MRIFTLTNGTYSAQSNGTACVPKWYPCTGSRNEFSTFKCCSGWNCVWPMNAPHFGAKRCEPPVPLPTDLPGDAPAARSDTICHSCRSRGFLCPKSCGFGPICVPRWSPCSGPKNRFHTSKCCTKGWRCVWPKNAPNFGAKQCEPPPPKCIRNWYHCRANIPCCSQRWRSKRLRNTRYFRGTRCEP